MQQQLMEEEAEVLNLIPFGEASALSGSNIADRTRLAQSKVNRALTHLVEKGIIHMVIRPRPRLVASPHYYRDAIPPTVLTQSDTESDSETVEDRLVRGTNNINLNVISVIGNIIGATRL